MSKKSIRSDLARLDRLKDSEIDYSDIPPLDKSFFTKATADCYGEPAPCRSRSTAAPKKNAQPRSGLKPA